MPLYLEPSDIDEKITKFSSVLIVPCRICPAMSLAVAENGPYIQFFTRFLTTPAYARTIAEMRAQMAAKGIQTGVYQSDLPVPMICAWMAGQRRGLLKKARQFDAVVVMGCDSAVHTVQTVLDADTDADATPCPVIRGMQVKGIVSVTPKVTWPGHIHLEIKDKRCVSWPVL